VWAENLNLLVKIAGHAVDIARSFPPAANGISFFLQGIRWEELATTTLLEDLKSLLEWLVLLVTRT
jgi:hypothetical protein